MSRLARAVSLQTVLVTVLASSLTDILYKVFQKIFSGSQLSRAKGCSFSTFKRFHKQFYETLQNFSIQKFVYRSIFAGQMQILEGQIYVTLDEKPPALTLLF